MLDYQVVVEVLQERFGGSETSKYPRAGVVVATRYGQCQRLSRGLVNGLLRAIFGGDN